jgi:thiamine-phosphate pyrophosphorylase
MKKKLRGLYAITNENFSEKKKWLSDIENAIHGGVKIIQYRSKTNDEEFEIQRAVPLKRLCEKHNCTLIINDNALLAKKINADGLHIGKNDISIKEAKKILGENSIIGVSCYNDIGRARSAEKNYASYVAFGSFFQSMTKPAAASADIKILKRAKSELSIPICAIGGINRENAKDVINTGVDMIALMSGIFLVSDINHEARHISSLFNTSRLL